MLTKVRIVTGSPALGDRLAQALRSRDVHVSRAEPSPRAWRRLARETFDVIVASEDALPAPPGDLFAALRASPGRTDVVVIVDRDEPEARATWLDLGALEVVSRFLSERAFEKALRALVRRRAEAEAAAAARSPVTADGAPRLTDFVSHSLAINELVDLARRVAATETSLVILGETGVGKEWLARAIHAEGPRQAGPFVAVNCAAIPEGLFESELFGHVEGAFTGALRGRRGQFELAHGGTLFLDEIVEVPTALQAKLLRAIQERAVQPLGAEELIPVDVRIIAATNRDLEAAVETGEFRSDLYYRLGVITLTVPPLRERRDDIPVLLETYRERFAVQLGREVEGVSEAAFEALVGHDWPGNVRELINVLERGVLLSAGPVLELADLPRAITGTAAQGPEPGAERYALALFDRPLKEARADLVDLFERDYLERALVAAEGRVGEAAGSAGIDPRTLYNKMRRFGLEKEDFRPARG